MPTEATATPNNNNIIIFRKKSNPTSSNLNCNLNSIAKNDNLIATKSDLNLSSQNTDHKDMSDLMIIKLLNLFVFYLFLIFIIMLNLLSLYFFPYHIKTPLQITEDVTESS